MIFELCKYKIKMDTHYRYISAPSTLNKKELYEEYCKLVEHSKRNDFLLSCEEGKTSKKHKETLKNMVEKKDKLIENLKEENKELIECVASLEDIQEKYEKKIEDLENKIVDLEEYQELFYKVREERDDIQIDLSDIIHKQTKNIERLEEEIKLKDELIKLHEGGE